MRIGIAVIVGCLLAFPARGQVAELDSVGVRLQRISLLQDDSAKFALSEEIITYLRKAGYGVYGDMQQVKYLGYKSPPEAEAELFSWSIPLQKGLAFYSYFKFRDRSRDGVIRSIPGEKSLFPAYLIYDFLPFKSGKAMYYILFGWRENPKSNEKVLLVTRFTSQGGIDFSPRLLKRGASVSSKLTFEYGKGMSMTLKPEKGEKRIIFDHLSAGEERLEGLYMFYGPDGTYDALRLKNGMWHYEEDVKVKD